MLELKGLLAVKNCPPINNIIHPGIRIQSLLQNGKALPWWLQREYLREQYGVYAKPTEVLEKVRSLNPMLFVHISQDDPELIAYIPSEADGLQDRRTKMTLGRFIKKYYPATPDDHIQVLVHAHHAELKAVIELIPGKDISKVYATFKPGHPLSACMSKPADEYHLPRGIRPTDVYDTPEIFLAVTRDDKGEINARCLVVHPADGGPKRYIRATYGPGLKSKLERLGYVPGGWEGVKFKTIAIEDGKVLTSPLVAGDTYNIVVPYLDSYNERATTKGSRVALVGGVLQGVDAKAAAIVGGTVADATKGYLYLSNKSPALYTWTDEITGHEWSKLDGHLPMQIYTPEGKILRVKDLPEGYSSSVYEVYSAEKQEYVSVRALQGTPTFGGYIDNDATRALCGYVRLDASRYPGHGWERSHNVEVLDGCAVLRSDTFTIFDGQETKRALKVDAKTLRANYIKLHNSDVYVPKEHKDIVKVTTSGKKVHQRFHQIGQLVTGEWTFTRGYSVRSYGAAICWVKQGQPSSTVMDKLRQRAVDIARDALKVAPTDVDAVMHQLVRSAYNENAASFQWRTPYEYRADWSNAAWRHSWGCGVVWGFVQEVLLRKQFQCWDFSLTYQDLLDTYVCGPAKPVEQVEEAINEQSLMAMEN